MILKFKKLNPRAIIPTRGTSQSAGLDLYLCCDKDEDTFTLLPGEYAPLPCAIAMSLTPGYEGQIRPRSGLTAKKGVTVLNTPGTVDSDYRGEIKVILINCSSRPVTFHHGDRIAQLVIAAVEMAVPCEVEELDNTERGAGGFGSTGS